MWVCKYLPYLLSLSLLCSHVIASPAPQAPGRIESPLPSATLGPNASASPADLRGSESGEAEEDGDDVSGDPTPTPTAVEERTDSVSVTTITRVDRTIQRHASPPLAAQGFCLFAARHRHIADRSPAALNHPQSLRIPAPLAT